MSPASDLRTALRVLQAPYRRQLLIAMSNENPQDDEDRDPLDIVAPEDEPDVLETELVHNHLPMLEDEGYIKWDKDDNKITKGPNWDEIEPLIELLDEHRDELPDGWL